MCYTCGGKAHPARLCPSPQDPTAPGCGIDEESDEQSADEGQVCAVDWKGPLINTEDEHSDILSTDLTDQGLWESRFTVMDSGAAENVLLASLCEHAKFSTTPRSDAGAGLRGASGERLRNHGWESSGFAYVRW